MKNTRQLNAGSYAWLHSRDIDVEPTPPTETKMACQHMFDVDNLQMLRLVLDGDDTGR
jgi:hypothetical protein